MSLGEKFLSGFRWVAAARLAGQLISWGGTLLVMRMLAPNDYGLAAICFSIVTIAAAISEFGFGAALVQAKTLEREQIRSVFGAAMLFALFSAGVMILVAPLLGGFFRAPEAVPLIRVSALCLLLAPLAMLPDAFLKRGMHFRGASMVDLVSGVCGTLCTLILAWNGAGVWALVLGPLAGVFVRVSLLNLFFPYPAWPSFRLKQAWELIVFGGNVAMSRLASHIFGQSDVLIAGRILNKGALGEYAVAIHLAGLPVTKVMGIVNQVAYPAIAQLNREGGDARTSLLEGLRLFSYALIPALWGVAVVAPALVRVLIGPAWEGAILPLQIVCIASPLRLISVLMSTAVQGMGRPDIDLKNTITGVIVLPACFLAGAFFGAVGLAMAWLIGLPILILINLQRAKTTLNVTISSVLAAIASPAACAAFMVVCVWLLSRVLGDQANSFAGLAAMVTCGVVCYVTVLWCTDKKCAMALLRLVRPMPAPSSE